MKISATIDHQGLPRDKGRIGAGEIYRCAHQVGRHLIALQRAGLLRNILEFFQLLRIGHHPVREREVRRDTVDQNAIAAQFLG